MERICRCCLGSGGVEHIFSKMEDVDNNFQSITYSEMISSCSSFAVKPTDGLPHKICHCCISELKSAYSFRNKCDKSYNTLRSVDKSLSVDLGLPKTRRNSQMFVNSEEEAENKCEEDFLEEECKDEKLIKIEFDDENSIDLPLEAFDCDIDQDEFLVERLADSESVMEEIKEEPISDVGNQMGLRLKKFKLKKDSKLKIKIKICPECGLTFKRKMELKEHMKTHPEYVQEKYFCKICQKYYKNEYMHRYSHKKSRNRGMKNNLKCPICKRVFQNMSHLNQHVKIHSEERKYSCEECGAAFKQGAALHKHRTQHAEDKYSCEFCSKTFKLKYNLTVHLRTHTNEKPFTCPVCQEAFSTGHMRNLHLDKHSPLDDMDKDSLAAFLHLKLASSAGKKMKTPNMMCPHCGKLFKRKADLTDHVNKHLGIKAYFCELCQKFCTSERKHKWIHSKNRTRRCEICLKTFASQQSLKNHISIHNDARPFVCHCGASFKQNAALYRHKALHKEKAFICHYCSKLFSTKYKLEIHMRIHTKERPYECDLCPLKFVTGNLLKTHKLRHSDYKGLVCDLCEKTFKTKSDLRQHMKVHEKIRKYPCKICSKNFFRSDHRNRHELTVHSMEAVKPENDDSLLI